MIQAALLPSPKEGHWGEEGGTALQPTAHRFLLSIAMGEPDNPTSPELAIRVPCTLLRRLWPLTGTCTTRCHRLRNARCSFC